MGDLPPGPRSQPMDNATHESTHEKNPGVSSPTLHKAADSTIPFQSQLSALPDGHYRPDFRSTTHPPMHYQNQEQASSGFNMGSIASALPDYGSQYDASLHANPQVVTRTLSGASPSAMTTYHHGQMPPLPMHDSGSLPSQSSYGTSLASGVFRPTFMPPQSSPHGNFPSFGTNQPRLPAPTTYQSYPQASPYMYYPSPYDAPGHYAHGFASQGAQTQATYGRKPSLTNTNFGMPVQNVAFPHGAGTFSAVRMGPGNLQGDLNSMVPSYVTNYAQLSGLPHSAQASSIPRGPPRKPKQSGHALWVGNLPPDTTVVALKDHFSLEATKDIESLFLISKSNCAFVNYRTEASCTAAMHRFHDSRFNGVRLVCRLRRSSTPASGIPTGPSAMVGSQQQNASRPATPMQDSVTAGFSEAGAASPIHESSEDRRASADTTNKYFIVKSLTLQDLELSVRNGIWATQSHNEAVLNKAFGSTKNVYLIFSANKSGEYFGYARMASPILENGSPPVPKTENVGVAVDVPKSIPTPATEWAPRGRIIDDSARGTIFWEAEMPETEADEDNTEKDDAPQTEAESSVVAQSWGKPFHIEWISTNRLPFYRTRGLRNPWNANREVKIARDGTELEPSVGERLIQMFHRLGPPTAATSTMPPAQGAPGPSSFRPF